MDTTHTVRIDLEAHSEYKLVHQIGKGEQADVFLITGDNGKYFACKAFTCKLNQTKSDVMIGKRDEGLSDINVALRMNHSHIIGTTDFIVGSNHLFLIMDCAECNLGTYLNTVTLTFSDKLKYIYQIGSALNHLHKCGYNHHDIKSINVLLNQGVSYLTDFGMARLKQEGNYLSQTYHFRSPEQLLDGSVAGKLHHRYDKIFGFNNTSKWSEHQGYGELWSFGILCLEIIYNRCSITFCDWAFDLPMIKNNLIQDPYITLLKLMVDKYEVNYKRDINDDVSVEYDVITEVFGTPSTGSSDIDEYNDDDLLCLVCDKLLVMNQDKRIKTLEEFLSHPMFSGMCNIANVYSLHNTPSYKLNLTFTKEGVYTPELIDEVVASMFKFYCSYDIPTFATLNAVDLFLQRVGDYVNSQDEICLFAVVCVKFIDMIHNLNLITLERCNILTLNRYGIDSIYGRIMEMIKLERGSPMFQSTFAYSPCNEIMLKAAQVMRVCKKYEELGGPRGVICELCRNETSKEFTSRTPKQVAVYTL